MATAREVLAGRAAVEIYLRNKLTAGLKPVESSLRRFAINVAAIGVTFASVQYAASRAMGIVSGALTGPADQLQNLSDRTGLTVETLQALGEAGADSGGTLEDVGSAARAMANFLQSVEHGAGSAATTLSELGLSADALTAADQDTRIKMFSDALDGIADPARRAALAQDVFGRGAMALIPVLAGGADKIEAYRKRLQETGGLRTAEQIAAADELGDSIGRLGRRITVLATNSLGVVAPAVTRLVDSMVGAIEATSRWTHENQSLAASLELVAEIGDTMTTGLTDSLSSGSIGLAGEIAMAQLSLAWTIGIGQIEMITADAMAAVGVAVVDAFSGAVAAVASMLDGLVDIYNQVASAIGAATLEVNFEGASRGAGTALKSALTQGAAGVRADVVREIAEAGAELAMLTGKAAKEAEERRAALSVRRVKGGDADGIDAGMEDRAKEIARQIGQGTFSATVAGALGRGISSDRATQEMLTTAHDQLEELRKIERKIGGKAMVGA